MEFGQKMREVRKMRKYSLSEVGDAIGSSKQQLSLYERGKRSPNAKMIRNIALALDVSADYLLGLTDEQPS